MDFSMALQDLVNSKSVRRSEWPASCRIKLDGDVFTFMGAEKGGGEYSYPHQFKSQDILATDWELFE